MSVLQATFLINYCIYRSNYIKGQTCDVLPNPTNGLVTITRLESPGILPGSQAVYTCNGGYEINGNSIHDCQSDGTWSGSEPSCVGEVLRSELGYN